MVRLRPVAIRGFGKRPLLRYPPPAMSTAAARITVRRPPTNYFDPRQIALSIDSEWWIDLKDDETVTRELEPGPHVIKADNTLFRKTIPFEVAAGEQITFVVENRPGFGTSFFMLLGMPWMYLVLKRD